MFQFEDPIKNISLFDHIIHFYSLNFNGNKIILAKCNKEDLKINKIELRNKILMKNIFWSKSELEDIKKFLEKDQISRLQEWIITRSMVKYGIGVVFNELFGSIIKIPFSNIFLNSSRKKKPWLEIELKNNNELKRKIKETDISISHSRKKIYVAFSQNQIGIDCEEIQDFSKRLISKIIKEREYNQIEELIKDFNINSKNFINSIIWTIKESTLKANGRKTVTAIQEIQISNDDNSLISYSPQDHEKYINYINIDNNSIFTISMKL